LVNYFSVILVLSTDAAFVQLSGESNSPNVNFEEEKEYEKRSPKKAAGI